MSEFQLKQIEHFLSKARLLSKMEVSEVVSIENILNCSQLAVVVVKSYEIETFIMGYHEYKASWTPCIGEELCAVMEPTDLMDKYAVAVQRNDGDVVGHLPLGQSGKFAKTIFYFLKADKQHSCRVTVHGKAVNRGDGKVMKVPCRLFFFAEERFVNVLKEKLSKLL